ncbi:hypothetical protein FALB51S_01147 [Frigidibacter albus]
MTDRQEDRLIGQGLPGRSETTPRISATEVIASVLTLCWLGLVAAFFLMTDGAGADNALGLTMTLVAICLPVAMIWVAAVTARTAREMRAEAQRLQGAIDAMRSAWIQQAQNAAQGMKPLVEKKLDEIAAAQRQTETAIATFTSRRDTAASQPSADRKAALAPPRAAAAGEDQPVLALGTPAEDMRAPVSVADFIQALNFPDSPEDRDGFRALRRALEDRTMAKLIRAAQDVLTLLAQDGIYMDDLKPDRAKPELWRRFAAGERGKGIAALGGVRDRSSLALTAGRMRQDTIFRDAAHHFLRQFDRTFQEFEKNSADQEVAEFAETRTARAFMLLGRVTGTFD